MIRTRFMDDWIADACASPSDGPLAQLVLLGTGLDSRAYRLDCLKGTAVFELDVAGVLQYKSAVFASLGAQPLARSLQRVTADFSMQGDVVRVSKTSIKQNKKQRRTIEQSPSDSAAAAVESGPHQPPWLAALLSAGFDPRQRTIWLAEGLLMYLGSNQVANMLSWIARLVNEAGSVPIAAPSSAASAQTAASSSAASVPAASSPPSSAAPALPLHTLVADVMNENMVRSKLRWFRFFRWGLARHTEADPTRKGPPMLLSPIEAFMRANGFEIAARTPGRWSEGYSKALTAGSEPVPAPSTTLESASSASSDPIPPAAPAHLHIHPIGRAHLSYGRYLAPPLMDSETEPSKPPRLLETYLIVANVRAI